MLKQKKGFTLIELLVVVAIIAVLAGLIIVRVGSSSADARNATREAHLAQVRSAIERAKNTGTTINTNNCSGYPCTRDLSDSVFTSASPAKPPSSFISGASYPVDPLDETSYRITIPSSTDVTNYVLEAPKAEEKTIEVGG